MEPIILLYVAYAALMGVVISIAFKLRSIDKEVRSLDRYAGHLHESLIRLRAMVRDHHEKNRKSHLHFAGAIESTNEIGQDEVAQTRAMIDENNQRLTNLALGTQSVINGLRGDVEQHVEKCVKSLGDAVGLEYVPGTVTTVPPVVVQPKWQPKAKPEPEVKPQVQTSPVRRRRAGVEPDEVKA